MFQHIGKRVAYRRAVRDEAAWLIAAQGENAAALARTAVEAERDPELWRFREAVAARVARELGGKAAIAQLSDVWSVPAEFGRDLAT